MGGVECHEFPEGYGHPIQCDTMEDVKAKGRMEFVYDETKEAEKLEVELKFLEKFSIKYKGQKELNFKHAD